MENHSFFVRDRHFYKNLFSLAAIIALQNIITFGVNLADNVMLGGYSESALSGAALVNQIQFLLQMLVMGTAEGIVVLSARAWGEKDLTAIRKTVGVGLKIVLCIAVCMWAVVFFFPQFALGLFTDDTAVIAEGEKYLRIVCFSYLFFGYTNLLLAILRSVETTVVGFGVSLSTLVINSCLNYVLIYGNFSAPRLGIQGAAIATLASRIVESILVTVYVFRLDKKIHMALSDYFSWDKNCFRQFLRTGLPVLLSNGMWGVAMGIQVSILGHMGTTAIAANSIANTVFQILTVVCYGAGSASGVIIGKSLGEGKNTDAIKAYARTLQVIFLGIGILTGLGLFLTKDVIIRFYNVSPEAQALALQFMTVLSITVVGTSYQVPVLTGIVRGGGDTRFVLYNDFIFMWLIILPISWMAAFVLKWSSLAVFICLKADQILKCFVAIVKVNRFRWIKKLHI